MASALVFVLPAAANAQGSSPREYGNVPIYTVWGFSDLIGTGGETAASSDIPLPNNVTVTRNGYLSLLYSFPINGKYAGVSASMGVATVQVTGAHGEARASGLTDPGFTFHMNFFGLPALRRDQFAKAVPQTYSSFHFTVTPPMGAYNRYSAVNTGGNRWTFTPSVSLSITPDKGISWLDLDAAVRFYTDNNAFLGSNLLTQNPLTVLVAHYSHNIGKRIWVSVGGRYDNGGQTFVNHVPQNDTANGFRPEYAIGMGTGNFTLRLRYENTASRPNAAPTNALVALSVSTPVYP